jgi:hypothetical protein
MKKIVKVMFFFAVGACALVACVAGLVWSGVVGAPQIGTEQSVVEVNQPKNGIALLTYKDSEHPESSTFVSVDTNSGTFTRATGNTPFFSPSRSAQGLFASAVREADGTSYLRVGENKEGLLGDDALIVVPEAGGKAGVSDWSSDGSKLVYESIFEPTTLGESRLDVSEIVLYDFTTQEQRTIDFGVSPVFFDETHVMYVRPDGIYTIDITASTTPQAPQPMYFFSERFAAEDARLVLSPDKKMVLITEPSLSNAALLAVTSTEEKVQYLTKIRENTNPISGFVFSPDSTQALFLENVADKQSQKDLYLLDLATFAKTSLGSIVSQSDDVLSISEWYE